MARQGSLADTLREVRLEHGLSQEELAHRMSTSQSWVARVESGALVPRLDSLQRWAAALGYTTIGIVFRGSS